MANLFLEKEGKKKGTAISPTHFKQQGQQQICHCCSLLANQLQKLHTTREIMF
jgi:hypothetical protein